MVKNQFGGNKSKKMGRKFLNTSTVQKKLRLAEEEGEIYAVVTKILGNGMFYANDPEGIERLCVMRNKFKGRGKRDNSIALGTWVLIGIREFESCTKPKCDLLEVYNEGERSRMKKIGDPIFSKLKSDHDGTYGDDTVDGIDFTNDNTEKYKDLVTQLEDLSSTSNEQNTAIIMDSGETVDVDDI